MEGAGDQERTGSPPRHDCSGGLAGGQICQDWARTWGGNGHEWSYGLGIDTQGNLYLPGGTELSGFGAGAMDVLLLKYDSNGTFVWARTWGGTGEDELEGSVFDDAPGGGFIVSGTTLSFGGAFDDVMLLKFDFDGNVAWARTWDSGGNDHGDTVFRDSTGDYYVSGGSTFWSPFFHDEVLLMKYDSSTVPPQNPTVVTWGSAQGDTSINDGCVWHDGSTGTDYIFVGGNLQSPANGYDLLLQKYDTSLNLIWSRSWGGSGEDDCWGVAADASGNVYVTGATDTYSVGQEDALLLKWDADGNLLGGWAWGGPGFDGTGAIFLDGTDVYLSSQTESFDPGYSDGLFLKFDTIDERFVWSKTWGADNQFDFAGLGPWNGYFHGLGATGPATGFLRDCVGTTTWIDPSIGVSSQLGPSVSRVGSEATPNGTTTSLPNSSGGGEEVLLLRFSACGSDPPGGGYCFGDPGYGTPCPCGNDNDGSVPGSGCANGVFASGAQLFGSGVASVTSDTLVLTATNTEPSNSGLYFQANNDLSPGFLWGDGLQCAGGQLRRLQVRFSDATGTSSTTVGISAMAGNVTAGDTKRYQCWYRNPLNPPCGAGLNDFNASNGYAVIWLP